MNRTILVNGDAATYCPPEIVCAYPASLPDSERQLLHILDRHKFSYVMSGKIVMEASIIKAEVRVAEGKRSIAYSTNSQELEARIAALVASEPGTSYRGGSND